MKGKIIKLATIVVVPHTECQHGIWICTVVASSDTVYTVGGPDVSIHEHDLQNGRPMVAAPVEKRR